MIEKLTELVARWSVAFIFVESGLGKFRNLDGVTAYFASLNIPYASYQAPFVAFVEVVAGLLLFVGFRARWAAVPLIVIMGVALVTAKAEEIGGVSDLLGTTEFLYLLILGMIASRRDPGYSADAWIRRAQGRTCQPQAA